ncbi:hypothetical protein EON65_15930 [archaeon]|nr:MAG: hypothetical protein EON65_15930 [archaeon]
MSVELNEFNFFDLDHEVHDEMAWQELFSSLTDSDGSSSPAHSDDSSLFPTEDECERPRTCLTDDDMSCQSSVNPVSKKRRLEDSACFEHPYMTIQQEPSRSSSRSTGPRATVERLMRCLNSSNVAALTSLIQTQTSRDIMLISPDVRDPCIGQSDLTLHFSFLMEAFPDGLWQIESTNGEGEQDEEQEEGHKLTFLLKFKGTKVFSEPLDKIFKQLRSQVGKRPVGALHQSITNCIQKTMDASFTSVYPATTSSVFPSEQNTLFLPSHVQYRQHTALSLMRSSRITYQREVSFYFNHGQQLVRVLEFAV